MALDADPDARSKFDALAFTHSKEFARRVADAKTDETRDRRDAETVERVRAGRKRR